MEPMKETNWFEMKLPKSAPAYWGTLTDEEQYAQFYFLAIRAQQIKINLMKKGK